jgi:nickel-dependent lactate racemase
LAGEETVGKMHVRSAIATPNALGIENNPTRQLIEAFAEKVGLHLIVNTALTRHAEIVKVFAGHFKKAHRRGVAFAKRIYAVDAPGLASITISTSYPADIDYWQGSKALYSADLVTTAGGTIIQVTPCPEGISPTHPKLADYLQHDTKELKEMSEQSGAEDLVALGVALELVNMLAKHEVILVSGGISERDLDKTNLRKVDGIQEAVDFVSRSQGPQSKMNILTNGGETYPVLT